jgi:hypothetical protein
MKPFAERDQRMQMPKNSPPAVSSVDPPHHQHLIALMVGRHPHTVCEVALDLWERLSKNLVAIIGSEGFEALYDRSVHLACTTFPWLAPADPEPGNYSRFSRLTSGLRDRSLDEARGATVLLLSIFTSVLSTFIGQQLTTNILRAAWGDAFDEAALEISQWPKK